MPQQLDEDPSQAHDVRVQLGDSISQRHRPDGQSDHKETGILEKVSPSLADRRIHCGPPESCWIGDEWLVKPSNRSEMKSEILQEIPGF